MKTWQRLRKEGYASQPAAELVGLPRSRLYRWQRRVAEPGLGGLEDGDRRPKRARGRTWSVELVVAVQQLREQYPGWGKDKLVVLLKREGWHTSASTVGRILSYLKQRDMLPEGSAERSLSGHRDGVLEPLRTGMRPCRQRSVRRPYAIRKPRGYAVARPGDLIQVDTLDSMVAEAAIHVRPLPGVVFKHF